MHREKAISSQENLQLRFTLLHPNRISHNTTRRKRAAATTALKIGTNTVTLQHRRLMAMATSRTFTTLTIIFQLFHESGCMHQSYSEQTP
jgi:hypothetical protein